MQSKPLKMIVAQTDKLRNGVAKIHQFGLVFRYATIGIVVSDSQRNIINFNNFAETLFGYGKEEVLGKKFEILVPLEYRVRHIKDREEFLAHPEPRIMGNGRDLFAIKKDGTIFPVEISLSPYSLDGEKFVIAFIVDITQRKKEEAIVIQQKTELEKVTNEVTRLNAQLEQQVDARTRMLQEALAELEESREELSMSLENEKQMSELKSKFVTLASHEFRTPLSTILSSAFLLEKYNDLPSQEQRMKHIHRIKSSVLGLKNILDDFLSVGKLEEGKVKNIAQEIHSSEIYSLVEEVTESMEQLLKPGQHIVFDCHSNANISTDRDILKNIIINLVSNAIKFSGDNSIINIICAADEKELSITVKDQGIGISEEDMKHLSERFFRATNAANIQGTGLGLHIVYKYLELIHGRLEIHSKLNEGSSFTIYLPTL